MVFGVVSLNSRYAESSATDQPPSSILSFLDPIDFYARFGTNTYAVPTAINQTNCCVFFERWLLPGLCFCCEKSPKPLFYTWLHMTYVRFSYSSGLFRFSSQFFGFGLRF